MLRQQVPPPYFPTDGSPSDGPTRNRRSPQWRGDPLAFSASLSDQEAQRLLSYIETRSGAGSSALIRVLMLTGALVEIGPQNKQLQLNEFRTPDSTQRPINEQRAGGRPGARLPVYRPASQPHRQGQPGGQPLRPPLQETTVARPTAAAGSKEAARISTKVLTLEGVSGPLEKSAGKIYKRDGQNGQEWPMEQTG